MIFRRLVLFLIMVCNSGYSDTLQKQVKSAIDRATERQSDGRPASISETAMQFVQDYDRRIEEVKPAINRVENIYNSQSFQENVKNANSNIKSLLLGETEEDRDQTSYVKPGITPMLFISSSVPLQTLRNYVIDIEKVDGVMVLKGMIEPYNEITPTLEFIRQLLLVDRNCEGMDCSIRNIKIAIDPERFSHYSINYVPALVIERDPDFSPMCQNDKEYQSISKTAYGDAALSGLMMAISTNNDKELKRMIDKLEGLDRGK